MPNSPLTNSRIPDTTYVPDIADIVHKAIYDIEVNACPRFTTTTARDTAYSAYVAAGGTLNNGRECWTDDQGFWKRVAGAWIPRLTGVTDPVNAQDVATKNYVDGSGGNLTIIGGWAVLANYHTPAWTLSNTGWFTLSGAVMRTAASFGLGTGTPFQIATLPVAPNATISPICYVGLGTGSPAQTYPARLYCVGGSTSLNIVGMDSGTGTIAQNLGYVNFDGVRFRI